MSFFEKSKESWEKRKAKRREKSGHYIYNATRAMQKCVDFNNLNDNKSQCSSVDWDPIKLKLEASQVDNKILQGNCLTEFQFYANIF